MNEESKTQEALDKYFEESETVTAQHILFKEFVEQYGALINKFQMYILFSTGWGNCTGKDDKGNLGYHKKVKLNYAKSI